MKCGMVRKVDELGRVVIPKEMRRILNIQTGSSVEMQINNNNEVVLKKFSEIENIFDFADKLGDIIFDKLNLKCLICDDEKVLVVKGVNKKEFLGKKILDSFKFEENRIEIKSFFEMEGNENVFVFLIKYEGFKAGYILIFDGKLTENQVEKIELLCECISEKLKF